MAAYLEACLEEANGDAAFITKAPQKLSGTMAFVFESRYIIRPTKFAMETSQHQHEYFEVWEGLRKNFRGSSS